MAVGSPYFLRFAPPDTPPRRWKLCLFRAYDPGAARKMARKRTYNTARTLLKTCSRGRLSAFSQGLGVPAVSLVPARGNVQRCKDGTCPVTVFSHCPCGAVRPQRLCRTMPSLSVRRGWPALAQARAPQAIRGQGQRGARIPFWLPGLQRWSRRRRAPP